MQMHCPHAIIAVMVVFVFYDVWYSFVESTPRSLTEQNSMKSDIIKNEMKRNQTIGEALALSSLTDQAPEETHITITAIISWGQCICIYKSSRITSYTTVKSRRRQLFRIKIAKFG
jgi:hypothetical protein